MSKAIRDRLYAWSGRLQHRITPGLPYSQTVFERSLFSYAANARRWLDLGCGHRLLPEWRGESEAELVRKPQLLVGLDADFPALRRHRSIEHRCLGDISALPFPDRSFDLVTANMVVEHLADPGAQFREVARVLMPGGLFVFHTPNARSYVTMLARMLPDGVKRTLAGVMEGRTAADVYPTYYRANRASSIERVAAQSGMSVQAMEFVLSSPAFSVFPPLLMAELLWIRQLQRRPALESYRHTLICALRRSTG